MQGDMHRTLKTPHNAPQRNCGPFLNMESSESDYSTPILTDCGACRRRE